MLPPIARKVPRILRVHGEELIDPYFWLREKKDPNVASYLQAENEYANETMKPTEGFQQTLYDEMLARIKETDVNVPYLEAGYFYYSRTEKGLQYPILCRKRGSLEAPEEIVLDQNELARELKFFSLGAYAVSDDGNLLAYSTDVTGFREYTLHVKDLRTGRLLPDRVAKTGSVVWAADSKTLFYTVEDAAKRQYRLYRHRLDATGPDVLVYEEADERFRVGAGRTRSRRYILLACESHTSSEWRILRADRPDDSFALIEPRAPDLEYSVDHHGDEFYILTNDKGRNFRLVWAPTAAPIRQNWEEVLPHRPEVMLEGIECFANHHVLLEREDGLPHLRVTDFRTHDFHRIRFPESAYSAFPGTNREFDTATFRYSYESLVTPRSIYDYDMDRRTATLLKRYEVLGDYDPSRYVSERIHAEAPDGTKIPVSLAYRRGTPRDGTAPTHLAGYGAYGYPYPITFNSNRLSLLDRGVVVALAHVRGGGDLGKRWHDEGRMLKKKNTFTDFVAAAEHLIRERITSPDRIVAEGASAGGLLMGAVVNLKPDLFRAVLSKVPFVDVLNTMLDSSLPLTVAEFEEWGNPARKEEYDYIRSYCPYTNLKEGRYPAMLVKTSFHDSQVMFWEPAKYVARLRTRKRDDRPLILKTNMDAGHGGASGRYDYLREVAFDYAWILWQLGLLPT
jgi:oligopeptidase B